ncbi:MAG: hypothetical protein WAL98_22180 [Desulfatiglandaceae bacterium]
MEKGANVFIKYRVKEVMLYGSSKVNNRIVLLLDFLLIQRNFYEFWAWQIQKIVPDPNEFPGKCCRDAKKECPENSRGLPDGPAVGKINGGQT